MIDVSRQLKPASKRMEKRLRLIERAEAVKAIHSRGAELLPEVYLVCHQSDDERGYKIRALAKQRIAKRNAKRLANSQPRTAKPRLDPVIAARSL